MEMMKLKKLLFLMFSGGCFSNCAEMSWWCGACLHCSEEGKGEGEREGERERVREGGEGEGECEGEGRGRE